MFQSGSFDVLELKMPTQGMNQNIDPNTLPKDFAYVLQNIVPSPLGSGSVRFGTTLVATIPDPTAHIIEEFPFVTPQGHEQLILYTRVWQPDVITIRNVGTDFIAFTTTKGAEKYFIDVNIRIQYKNVYLESLIDNVFVDNTTNTVTLSLATNKLPTNIKIADIQGISFAKGVLYCYDFVTHAFTNLNNSLQSLPVSGFSLATVPRSTTFLNNLIICNGVNNVVSWDGQNISYIYDYIKEPGNTFVRIDDVSFSFVLPPNSKFNANTYQNNVINLSINGIDNSITSVNAVRAGNNITINTKVGQPLPNWAANANVTLAYQALPPTFSYITVIKNRLWALGPGNVGLEFRSNGEAMQVYFAYRAQSISKWFAEDTRSVPVIDVSEYSSTLDNIEAIVSINNYVGFVGRQQMQIWSWNGNDPHDPQQFFWNNNLPVGIPHGNLIVNLPNDIYVISNTGLLSYSTYNIAKQFAATSLNAIDPLIRKYVASIMQSNVAYRACRAFKYQQGPFCGFKIGFDPVLVSLFSSSLYAWSMFTGDFQYATAISGDSSKALYLCNGGNVYRYADKASGAPIYGDNNGTSLIEFQWILPIYQFQGKRWANSRFEILMDYGSNFVSDTANEVSLQISGDLRETFNLDADYILAKRGDVLGEALFSRDGNLGFHLNYPYTVKQGRLKFVSSRFWVCLRGNVRNSPVNVTSIRLFGALERRG